MFDHKRMPLRAPELSPTARELMRSAEREIAEHGYSGAQLKRAARSVGSVPAQYNYYFSAPQKKAVEGVADTIFRNALSAIDIDRVKMISAMDKHYGVSSFTMDQDTLVIDVDVEQCRHHVFKDIIRLSLLPTMKYMLQQKEDHGGSYYARFSLMMYLECPSVYDNIAEQQALPGHDYMKVLGVHLVNRPDKPSFRGTTEYSRQKVLRMQWLMLAGFEQDLMERGSLSATDKANIAASLLNGISNYVAADLLEGDTALQPLDRELLQTTGII